MTRRIYNFSAGPAILPESVLEEARDNLLSFQDTGIGICEHSHRGAAFTGVRDDTEAMCRELASIPDNYHVLFLQGGASTQFFQIPMNFLSTESTADYVVTGSWSKKAVTEARRFGSVHQAASGEETGFTQIPSDIRNSDNPVYVHFTSNNTIYGTQFRSEPPASDGNFLVCDASSDIFSRPLDVSKYGIIYGGAQKNLGPSGVTLVIIRDDLVERGSSELPTILQYRTHAASRSLYNTPPTFGIYLMGRVFRWLLDHGGLAAAAERNQQKAQRLYDYLDTSSLFNAMAARDSRSQMNVTFVTGDSDLDARFVKMAADHELSGLKGHRSAGGMRASLYNAFPIEGVDALIEVMKTFEAHT